VVDQYDNVLGSTAKLLIGATSFTLEQTVNAIHDCGGLAIASHIDRQRFGLVGQLGFIPDGLPLDAVEVSPRSSVTSWNPFPVGRFGMKKVIDWLFLSDTQYWEKYILPTRLGSSPYEERIRRNRLPSKPGFIKRMVIAILS
jgi:hypothetical protein